MRKEEEENTKRDKKAIAKAWQYKRDLKKREGVQARKEERERVKKVKQLMASKQDVPPKLLIPIPDPQKIWEAEQAELARQEEMEKRKQKEEEVVIDTVGDPELRLDYMPFPEMGIDEDSSSSGSDESEIYNSDNDYSWHRH
jgi:hypothetical protein